MSIFSALVTYIWEKLRFHPIYGLINVWKAFSQLAITGDHLGAQHIWIIHSPLQKSCQGYLCCRPTSPPAQRPGNACPILTSFVLPTGLWFSTRPSKSNYTGVREVDFPIIDSMLRMRADDNTHITPLLTPPLLSPPYFVSISLCPSLYFCISSYLIPLFPKTFFLPPSLSLYLSFFHSPLF